MKPRAALLGLAFALLPAAGARAAAGSTVELPPMMVEESVSSVPWLYARAGSIEFLSRCSASTTRSLAENWLARLQLVRALVPDEFLTRMQVPSVFVLYAQNLEHTVSAEIRRELQARDDRADRVDIAPSMRLTDRDMHGTITYIDETLFDASTLSITSNHVRYLLSGNVPDLPAWLIDGFERTWRRMDFVTAPITVGPLVWVDGGESDALADDPARPRALLPAAELFANDAQRAAENRHPRRQAVRAATQELFVRWALVTGEATRTALWQFAKRAAAGPVAEADFEACFGFDYADLRDRLSDYLPRAVTEMAWIDPGKRRPLPRFEVERATPNEIARVRGEWERLAIGHVQRRLPQVLEPYIAQARRTLRRAYDAGDRDPRLLATMGLCEIDAGNPAEAGRWLEQALATGVVRPRVAYELAWIRWADLRRGAPDKRTFTFGELAPVLDPLRRSLAQPPPLAEAFELLGEVWAHCELGPNAAERAELENGARLFAARATVGLAAARALARHGHRAEASAVLAAGAGAWADTATRTQIEALRAELAAGASPGADGR